MRLALTLWNGRISPVCDVARRLVMLIVEQGKITARQEFDLLATGPLHQARLLAEHKPDVLVCGAISRSLANLLTAQGIRVLPFVSGTEADVTTAFLKGALPNPDLAMPGCCGAGFMGRGRRRAGLRRRHCPPGAHAARRKKQQPNYE